MKIAVVNFSDSRGGAAAAVSNLVDLLSEEHDVDFIVAEKLGSGKAVGPNLSQKTIHFILRLIAYIFSFSKNRKIKYSINIFSSSHVFKELIGKKYDVVHFNWLNNETISISKIEQLILSKPKSNFIFTLHDDWLLAGGEHCIINDTRYISGYSSDQWKDLLDLDCYVYRNKLGIKYLFDRPNVYVTTPSKYLLSKVKDSLLLKSSKCYCLPNAIDTDIFDAYNKSFTRKQLGLPSDRFIILFGAFGKASYLKGNDLLESALELINLKQINRKVILVSFGTPSELKTKIGSFELINMGKIVEKSTLAKLYSAADITIVPSRSESFSQVAAESLACSTPVIGFEKTGLVDFVVDGFSGYTVPQFDIEQLSQTIVRTINLESRFLNELGSNGKEIVRKNFANVVVKDNWSTFYKDRIK
ncbi:glycosyltransferase [Vibrio sp. CAU 1672]|uniref:glycosyltransferase n=1 Tax=Vibrio sp. CAU 1672 TaxID=3032594 RepID=UPI0023DB1ECE|nr:glycosyltransferase [Vibrio sp. CAU 1672]MDF2155713.1 glycosyltransferase [Vibrio sp. CAU 1672]